MSRDDFEKVRQLVDRIDDANNSVVTIREVTDNLIEHGGDVKLCVNTEMGQTAFELSTDVSSIALQEVLKSYNRFISKCKDQIDAIINKTMQTE